MIDIRPLAIEDVPAASKIEQTANRYPWSENVFRSCFATQYFNFGLYLHDSLIGYYIGYFQGVESQLFNVCVSEAQQGKSYGSMLLQHFITQSIERSAVDAWLEVRQSNIAAIRLYENAGFIQTGIRPRYYRDAAGAEDAVLMSLPLQF